MLNEPMLILVDNKVINLAHVRVVEKPTWNEDDMIIKFVSGDDLILKGTGARAFKTFITRQALLVEEGVQA